MGHLVFGGVATALGVLLIASGALALRADRRRKARWIRTPGRVVATEESHEGFQPKVEFRPAGSERVFHETGNTWYDKPRWKDGDEWIVRHEPSDPSRAFLSDDTGTELVGRLLLGFGLALACVGIFVTLGSLWPPARPYLEGVLRALRSTNSGD